MFVYYAYTFDTGCRRTLPNEASSRLVEPTASCLSPSGNDAGKLYEND